MLDDTLFNPNFDALFIAHIKEEALKIFDNKIDFAWKNFDDQFKQLWGMDNERANAFKFDFGDKTFSSISVSLSGRSGTYQRIHVTEFAKMCKDNPMGAKEIITGTIPTLPLNGRLDIESTADGEFGFFHDMFWEAWNRGEPTRQVEFKAHFYNWQWDEEEMAQIQIETQLPKDFLEYQIKHKLTDREISYYYLKWLSLNKNWEALRQEYPTTPEEAFIASGNKLFSKESLDKLDPQEPKETQGDWAYFDDYKPNHRYALGADVSEGLGLDSSTCTVWDFSYVKPKVVARYKNNKIEPDIFAYEIKAGGNRFGTCLVAVERNNHGHTTLAKLKEIYPTDRIYKEIRKDKATDKTTEKLGWHTNNATKPKMLYDFNTALNEELVDIPDKVLIFEARIFDKSDLSEGRKDEFTRHYDVLMSAVIGYQMKDYADVINPEQEQAERLMARLKHQTNQTR